MPSRIVSSNKTTAKPSKPRPDFPLTPHSSGKWCKKVRGRLYYFGEWADPDNALNEWLDRRDGIYAGRDHEREHPSDADDDVAALCNAFLASKRQLVEEGDLDGRTYTDYERVCDRFVAHFGKRRKLTTIRPTDFGRYRASWPSNWGPATVNGEVGRVRTILNYGYENELVDRPFRTGENFKRVSKRRQRLHRESKPKRLFTAGEVHRLLDASCVQLRGMILLGLNCSYGPSDCGRLTESAIDWDQTWLERLRPKTAIPQSAWLWPETVKAIEAAIANRYQNAPASLADRVFVTKRRQAWFREGEKNSAICHAFGKLKRKALTMPEAERLIKAGEAKEKAIKLAAGRLSGVGFYALRSTFETVAGNTKDQIAVNYVMGHADESMAAVYREGIDRQRIIDVCGHVRDWWLEGNS